MLFRSEINRFQLRMTIGKVQQMHIAEARQVVEARWPGCGEQGFGIECCACGGGDGQEIKKFASLHGYFLSALQLQEQWF